MAAIRRRHQGFFLSLLPLPPRVWSYVHARTHRRKKLGDMKAPERGIRHARGCFFFVERAAPRAALLLVSAFTAR